MWYNNTMNEDGKMVERLEHAASCLNKYIRCLKGEEQDLTGRGIERIFIDTLEHAMDVKVVTREECDASSTR